MPAQLKNYQFPRVYAPWYVYEAIVSRSAKIERYDILQQSATVGTFEQKVVGRRH